MAPRTKPKDEPTAIVPFDAKRAGTELTSAVNGRRDQLAALLGADLETERGRALLDRFVTVALHAATSRPDILRASQQSIVESIRDAAMLGLEPVGVTGDGSIVVYDETVAGRKVPTAHFQPMYRGLLKLARRSGSIANIDAHVVYVGDVIELELGSNPMVRHAPALDGADRGTYRGVYAVAELMNGRRYVDWMTFADVELVRKKSRARDAMAWTDFWPEMARKTVLRRLMKRLPLETTAEHALRIENEAEERSFTPALADMSPISDARERVRARLGAGQAVTEDQEPTTEAPAQEAAVSVDPERADETTGAISCGAGSDPTLGEVEYCALSPGHSRADGTPSAHKAESGSVWPNQGGKE